jgi:hypothetical protein
MNSNNQIHIDDFFDTVSMTENGTEATLELPFILRDSFHSAGNSAGKLRPVGMEVT